MKEQRNRAKDGPDADPMKEMRKRYERAVEAERDNRAKALDDFRFVAVPGSAWDDHAKKQRKGRPCYEFPILRSHWRQVCNDQKKARPGIKVRAVSDSSKDGAELRQGLIRNIESTSNAEWAYDQAHEMLVATGYGAWRVTTKYSEDDGWDQDLLVKPIKDVLTAVWSDPDGSIDDPCGMYTFVEESITRDEFERRYPKAEIHNFGSEATLAYGDWFGEKTVRIAEYWRKVPIKKTIHLLSDGRSVDEDEYAPIADEMQAQGITITRSRVVDTTKVVMSIVSGCEEIEGPFDSVFHKIPIVQVYANRQFIDGKWSWMGMVRPSKDPQRLVNYNFTTAQEVLSKQHKATPIVTPKMLEGKGVAEMWDSSNTVDRPYLVASPDPLVPGGPTYLSPPPIQNAFAQMGQMAIDMLKASDGIYDASVGARSNETSGKAIMARQQEGDTATFDYQDSLSRGIQLTGELIGYALPKVYDTPRMVRIIGKDGSEDYKQLYEEVIDGQTGRPIKVNDLSAGKYDYTVTTGPAYDTQRMEFVDALVQLAGQNPLIGQAVPDLIVGSMDFPKAEEAAERLKLMLPPQIQQAMNKDKPMPPEVQQAMAVIEQQQAELQQAQMELQQAAQQVEEERVSVQGEKASIEAAKKELAAQARVMDADQRTAQAELKLSLIEAQGQLQEAQSQAEEGTNNADERAQASTIVADATEKAAQILTHAAEMVREVTERAVAPAAKRRIVRVIKDEAGEIVGAEAEDAD